jgi:hypothetical protein
LDHEVDPPIRPKFKQSLFDHAKKVTDRGHGFWQFAIAGATKHGDILVLVFG